MIIKCEKNFFDIVVISAGICDCDTEDCEGCKYHIPEEQTHPKTKEAIKSKSRKWS